MSALYLSVTVYQNRQVFLTRFNPSRATERYNQSQWQQSQNFAPIKILDAWAEKQKSANWNDYVRENGTKVDVKKLEESIIQAERNKGISDAELYAYAGYKYMQGTNPTLLNPEHPPLGKYLIGLSIRLFGNENILALMIGVCILIIVYGYVYQSTRNRLLASSSVLLTATQTLFIDQIIHGPQLEIYQVFFFLVMLALLQVREKRRPFLLLLITGIVFGCLLSVKTFATHYPLFVFWLLLLTLGKRIKPAEFITINTIGFLVFVATYFEFFLEGGTIRKWLGVQKYIVLFYKQSGINTLAFLGNYLRLIFTGSWKFWSGNNPVTRYGGWSLMWPVVFAAGTVALYRFLAMKGHKTFAGLTLAAFILPYNAFLFFIPIFPRYLLLLFVPLIMMMCVVVQYIPSHEKK